MRNQFSTFFRKASFLGLFLALMSVQQFYAQKTVTGMVTDETNQGIPGVNILKQGTSLGVSTDFDGNYTVQVLDTDVLVFSFVGYKTQSITVGTKSILNVQLDPDVASLDEVVIIGYGTAKKSDLTGSVSSISSKDLLKAPISKIGAGLQGKISGVNIQQTSGAPGQGMKIRIRGGSSINYSNSPLYVIDGFIGADISTINPSDIASINFLKDASATAIYGSRGANGVVLVTTVAPKEGALRVTIESNVGLSNMVNSYDLLPAYEQAELLNLQNISKGNSAYFTDAEIAGFKENGGTDWVNLVSRQGIKHNHTLNITGGNENLKYFFSANNLDEGGVIKNSFYKRTSLRSNIAGKIGKKINFKFNTYGTHIDSQANGVGTGGISNTIGSATTFPQQWESRDADGNFINPTNYSSFNGAYLLGRFVNPEQKIRQNQETLNDKIISNIDLDVALTDKLKFVVGTAGSFASGYHGQRTLADNVNINQEDITAQQRYSRGNSWLFNSRLTYENEIGDHKFKVSGVYELSKSTNRSLIGNVGNLKTLSNEWYLLSNGTPSSTLSTYNLSKLRSYMARLNYSYKGKYLLTASMRADGSSKFNKENRWGYFPSAAIAWKASEEDFVQNIDWISNLKFRAGFGSVGNQAVGAYSITPSFANANSDDSKFYGWYQLDDNISSLGIVPGNLTDTNLKWETTTSFNAGIDFGILDSKITGTLDVYSKKATDVIIAKSIPKYTGKESVTANYADIDNTGVELGINWHIKSTDDFNWSAYANFTRNKNTVQNLGTSNGVPVEQIFVQGEDALGLWNLKEKFVVQKGKSMGALWGLKAIGIWQESEAVEANGYGANPGEVKYDDLLTVDTNADGIPDAGDGQYSSEDRQVIGNANPDFTYGLGTSMSYKEFDLSVQCIGTVGNEIYNWTRSKLNELILTPDYRNRWSPTNTSSTQQLMPIQSDQSATAVVSQYIEDGSFFKISNITLGYNLPENVTEALKISSLRFYASVDNVLTITNYSGLDPEGSSTAQNSDSQSGIDAFSYPLTRTVSAGVKVSF